MSCTTVMASARNRHQVQPHSRRTKGSVATKEVEESAQRG